MAALGKASTGMFNSVQKSTLIFQNGRPTSTASLKNWDLHKPLGKDRWNIKEDFDGNRKPLSTMAYARKLQCEEELRCQTKGLRVPLGQIVKEIPRQKKSFSILNDL